MVDLPARHKHYGPCYEVCSGNEVPGNIEAYFNLEMVTDHRCGLYVQPTVAQPRPSSSRVILKPPYLKRAKYARILYSALHNTRLRLRSVSRSPLRRRSKGPQLHSKQEVESRRHQAEAPKEPSPASPASASPDPLGVFPPPQQRWWYPVLVAKKGLPATIQTGIELKVLDETICQSRSNNRIHAGN